MRELDFAAEALESLRGTRARNPRLGERLDAALDLAEAEPPDVRAKRRGFSGGKYAIEVALDSEEWLIIWAENQADPSSPHVYYIGPSFL